MREVAGLGLQGSGTPSLINAVVLNGDESKARNEITLYAFPSQNRFIQIYVNWFLYL